MKKLSIILCLLFCLSLLTACELPDTKPILLGNALTLNQFWNGILVDEEATVYDQTHNPQRFAKTGSEDYVKCIAIKDYNVYMMYDFGSAANMSDYLLEMLESWKKYEADVECIPTANGIFYIMQGQHENCNVVYVSNSTLILGMGNPEDEAELKDTVQDMIDSSNDDYDTSRIQSLPLVQNVKKVKIY